ncbi:MAG: hypothetical protein V1790_04490 [Planctomycetota bacterium]
MMLKVPDYVDVQLGSRQRQPIEPAACAWRTSRFSGDHLGRFAPTEGQVGEDCLFVVHQLLLSVLKFFVVAEEIRVVAMKDLPDPPEN